MPKYKKKITRLMEFEEFSASCEHLPIAKRAFLNILFFAGCRISEALALSSENISCTRDTIYIEFRRLKGSKQTDPLPLPKADALLWLCDQEGKLFSWCRKTGYNIVKSAFPDLYPHYFRMNRITTISEKHGDSYVYSFVGITAGSIDHYRGKVDIKKVGQALKEELIG